MKKEVILVPKDKCPLDVLAEMGEQTKDSLIFFHENVVEKLKKTAQEVEEKSADDCQYESLYWHGTEEYPDTTVEIEDRGVWREVYFIDADDIAFGVDVDDPENLFFFKMAE